MACEENCFTFTWKLENVSYCLQKKEAAIDSPTFVVDSIGETKWYLSLYPRGEDEAANYTTFYLFREEGSARVEIKYELAFVSNDGSRLTAWDPVEYDFSLPGHGFPYFAKRDDVFIEKRSAFLPLDTLTARCHKLMAMKSSYLPDDILSLHWEFAFSKGVISKEIENVQYGCTKSESEFPNYQNVNNQSSMSHSYSLNHYLKSLLDENFLCDVKLKTSTRNFNAHRVILSASSSVFKAMFSSDMKEKDSSCVNIEDLSDDTIDRMLDYVYTARMGDLTWECASQLYVAADKYAIFSLKNICSSYMKDNLSPSNVCEVLLLSDFHADDDLKTAVQNSILKNIKDVINCDGWKTLMETNAKLAAETLCLQHK